MTKEEVTKQLGSLRYTLSPCVIYLASVLVVLRTGSYRKRRHHTNIYVTVPCGERRLLLTYFKYITTFKALHCLTSLKVGARYIDKCMYEVGVSLILNGSTAIHCFKHGNMIKIQGGITFRFLHRTVTCTH